MLDIDFVRSEFPGLEQNFIFMDNAGGSQVLGTVIEKMSHFMTYHNVQLGASYSIASQAGKLLNNATRQLASLVHANKSSEIILGSSSTALLKILSICLSQTFEKGDEIIITNTDHEANVSCWTALESQGIIIRTWQVNPRTFELDIEDLETLLNSKTKLLTLTHCSNVLGTINPIKSIAKTAHQNGTLVCVDGVAFAPHRQVDVQDLDVDFYVYSYYKTFGPHAAILYGKQDILEALPGINHYFINTVPYKFQPGNFNYEMCYGMSAIPEYLQRIYNHHFKEDLKQTNNSTRLAASFKLIAQYEELLSSRLMEYLTNNKNIRIIGKRGSDQLERVSTISFVHNKLASDKIVEQIDQHKIGIRYGDFYAKKLVQDLELTEKNGVVRVS